MNTILFILRFMNNELKFVSKMFAVPLKSFKRWIKVGTERKKGMNLLC